MEGFHVFDDYLQGACFVVFFVFTPICSITTILRFIASRIATGKPGIEDCDGGAIHERLLQLGPATPLYQYLCRRRCFKNHAF